jgi:hypothetical protein
MIGKPGRSGEMFKLTIGLYNCVCSDKSFRSVIGKEKITLKGILEKNNSLEEQLMEATSKKSELEGVVKALEEEKAQLFAEVEALRAIPMLEERVSSLESDIAKLRDEKGALMSRLTKLVTDAPSTVQPAPVEKPLEAYISEAVTIGEPAPPEESICECQAAETEEIEGVTEAPAFDATSTEVSALVNLPVVTPIEEKPVDVPQVEAAPVSAVPEEVPVNTACALCDTVSTEEVVETPLETIFTDVTPVEAFPAEEKTIIVEVVEASPIDVVSVEIKHVEMPAIEKPFVVEVVEAASTDNVQVDVPSSEPQIVAPVIEKPVDAPPEEVQVEAHVEVVPEITQTVTAPVETATVPTEEVQEIQGEPLLAVPLIEVKPVEVVPAEATPVENPTPVQEKPAEISPPLVTLLDVPSIEEVPTGDKFTEPITDVVSSVEVINEVASDVAQELEVEKPVEAIVSESSPPNIPESVQVVPVEAAQPESQAKEQDESTEAPVVENPPVEVPNVETPVIEIVSIGTTKVEEVIVETLPVEDKQIEATMTATALSETANFEKIVAEVQTGEASSPAGEKQTELQSSLTITD